MCSSFMRPAGIKGHMLASRLNLFCRFFAPVFAMRLFLSSQNVKSNCQSSLKCP